MAVPAKSGKSGSRGEPEKTRAAILKAALEEFAHEGITGARTDEIARRAGVNKALLYYYFKDYIASSPMYPRLVQREFMRSGARTLSPLASRILERYGRPIYTRLESLIAEGAESGDFRKIDPAHTVTSILGTIVFYFISLPAKQFLHSGDPASAERIAERREAVLDFICAAVFAPVRAEKSKNR